MQLFSGTVMTIFNVTNFAGTILLAVIANRTNSFMSIIKLAYGFGVVSAIAVMESS